MNQFILYYHFNLKSKNNFLMKKTSLSFMNKSISGNQ